MTAPRVYLYRVRSAKTGTCRYVFARTSWDALCAAYKLGHRGSAGVRLAHPCPF